MDLSTIQHAVDTLWQELNLPAEPGPEAEVSFNKAVLTKYKLQLLTKLKSVFEGDKSEAIINLRLTSILQENWEEVKSNLCAYTALPDDKLTLLLCDIAEFLAQQSAGKKPIEFLMPTIQTISYSENYSDLGELPLREVLCTHIISADARYLIPVRIVVSPVHPDHPYRNPYCNYAVEDSPEISPEEFKRLERHSPKTKVLPCLQETLFQLEHDSLLEHLDKLQKELYLNSKYKPAEEKAAVENIKQSQSFFLAYWGSLSEEIRAIIPVYILKEIQKVIQAVSKLVDDSEKKSERKVYPSAPAPFSPSLSLEAGKFKKQSTSLCSRQRCSESLRKFLIECHDELALIRQDHSIQITELQKQREKEIILLSSEFVMKPSNYKGQDSLSITADLLRKLDMKLHITSFAQLQELVQQASAYDLQQLSELEDAASEFSRNINSIEELVSLLTQEHDETKLSALLGLIKDKFLDENFLSVFDNFSHVLSFLTPGQIKVVLTNLQDYLYEKVESAQTLQYILEFLTPEQCTVVCQTMQNQLSAIIKDAWSIRTMLGGYEELSPCQCAAICQAIHEQLLAIIQDGDQFRDLLEILTADDEVWSDDEDEEGEEREKKEEGQRTIVFKAMQEQLPAIIKEDIGQFASVLLYLSPDQRTIVHKAMQEYLHNDLILKQYASVFDVFQKHPSIEYSKAERLGTMLSGCTAIQCAAVCHALRNQIFAMIKDDKIDQLGIMLKKLTVTQCSAVCKVMHEQLSMEIKFVNHIHAVLKDLTYNQCMAFCLAIYDLLPKIIHAGTQFRDLFRDLTADQCVAVFEVMLDQLSTIIQNGDDFENVLLYLNPDQRATVYKIMQDQLLVLSKNSKQPNKILSSLSWLTSDQRTVIIFEIMRDQLPEIITDAEQLGLLFGLLQSEQYPILYTILHDQLPAIIQNGFKLGLYILAPLSEANRTNLLNAIQDQLPAIIQDGNQFRYILNILRFGKEASTPVQQDQCSLVFEVVKTHLPAMIKDGYQFGAVLEFLTDDQRMYIFQAMKHRVAYEIEVAKRSKEEWNAWEEQVTKYEFQAFLPQQAEKAKPTKKFLEQVASVALFENLGLSTIPLIKADESVHKECLYLGRVHELIYDYHGSKKSPKRFTLALRSPTHFTSAGRTAIDHLERYLNACEENGKTHITKEELIRLQNWARSELVHNDSATQHYLRNICELLPSVEKQPDLSHDHAN